jgi:hypothetical protein
MLIFWTEVGNLHVDDMVHRSHKVTIVFHGMRKAPPAEKLALLEQVVTEARKIPESGHSRILQ